MRHPKICFKVSGSSQMGLGHVRRSSALARQMLRMCPEVNVSFCSDGEDKAVQEFLEPFAIDDSVIDEAALTKIVLGSGADILVMDDLQKHGQATADLKKTRPALKITALDYFYYDNPHVDIVVNLLNQNREVSDPSKVFHGQYLEGHCYAIIREDFYPFAGPKQVRSRVKKVFITFGGADSQGHSLACLSLMKDTGFHGEVDLVLGPFFYGRDKIESFLKEAGFLCRIHQDVKQMATLMSKTDLCFCGGGTTMLEVCCLGLPAVIMPQNKEEKFFAQTFLSQGAISLACSREELSETAQQLMESVDKRMDQSAQASRMIDGKGVERIASLFLKGSMK